MSPIEEGTSHIICISASGVGFWGSQAVGGKQAADNSGRFIPKEQLKAIGSVTPKSGAPATFARVRRDFELLTHITVKRQTGVPAGEESIVIGSISEPA